MKICMTLAEGDFPTDVRVENEAKALIQAGHQVTIVARQLRHANRTDYWQGITIVRIPRLPVVLRQINAFVRFRFHFNFFWFTYLFFLQKRERFDVFHVHDLPLAGTVLLLGRLVKRPVMLDFHENYPVALQTYQIEPVSCWQKMKHRLFYDLHRWKNYEARSVASAQHLIVVVDEAKDRLKQIGQSSQKITVVSNTLNISHFEQFAISPDICAQYADKFVISYVGTAAKYRYIQTVIASMPIIIQSISQAHLLVVGNADKHPWLHSQVDELNLHKHVTFTGLQPFKLIPSYIQVTHIGVMPHQPNEHTNNTIPHKLFQYMYFQKPVIVSNCDPLTRIVTETGCGLVCRAEVTDAQAWAEAILSLQPPEVRWEMGQRGRQAVINKYNWQFDVERLVNAYRELANAKQ